MEGLFSVKSDVYSFGVLLLELVSGLRNSSFHSPECSNLIRHVSPIITYFNFVSKYYIVISSSFDN